MTATVIAVLSIALPIAFVLTRRPRPVVVAWDPSLHARDASGRWIA